MVDHENHPSRPSPSGQVSARDPGGDRVAKVLARAGVASRRDIERLISEGRVALNGQMLTTPAVKVGPNDILTVNGAVVSDKEPTRLWRYHKPVGLLTAHKDPKGRPVVFDHLPEGLPRVISIGRLDIASEGLLLLTNDGELARSLEMPTTGWVRQYRVRAYGHTSQAKLDTLKEGVTVEGVRYGAVEAKLDKMKHAANDVDRKGAANVWLSVSISEGKNREVRRVLEHIGLKVNRLIRLAYGPFALNTLPAGAAEEVGPRVIREQLAGIIPTEQMPPEKKGERNYGLLLPKGKAPALRSDRPAQRRAAAAEPKPKKEFKEGWAKPKKKLSPHAAPAKGAKPGARKAGAKASPHSTDLTFKPTRTIGAKPAGRPPKPKAPR
jgi:23S rRNA pseudouridine2605 synthase